MIVRLDDLQRAYRAQQNGQQRVELRQYLLDRANPSGSIYQLVSRRLYADGLIDNLGLCDTWVAIATKQERTIPFSQIATALLGQ